MEDYFPPYYPRFRCLAGDCPDSCCQGWVVSIDEAAAARYRALPGALGDALRAAMTASDGEVILENHHGRCPMWRPDGLCRIQAELGEAALSDTCRRFPRLCHDYGTFRELDLELSCPEAARLMLTGPIPVPPVPEAEDPVLKALLASRRQGFSLLTRGTVPEALTFILLYGCYVQGILDGAEPEGFSAEGAYAQAQALAAPGDAEEFLAFFCGLNHLGEAFPRRLAHPAPGPWREEYRTLAGCFLRRYWLQAVSDGDLYGRVKLAVVSAIAVRLLGGDPVTAAQLYAKEVENDPDNLEQLLDGAYRSPALTDDKLLGLLLL